MDKCSVKSAVCKNGILLEDVLVTARSEHLIAVEARCCGDGGETGGRKPRRHAHAAEARVVGAVQRECGEC